MNAEIDKDRHLEVAKDQIRILLQKMRWDCSCHGVGWCTLLELEVASHRDPRMLIQFKCVEKYKYIISKDEGRDFDFSEATHRWIADGKAKKFGELYKPTTYFSDYDIQRLFDSVLLQP